jgi:hypothetical protein
VLFPRDAFGLCDAAAGCAGYLGGLVPRQRAARLRRFGFKMVQICTILDFVCVVVD